MITLYTDGACSGNPGPGGWALIIPIKENQAEVYSGYIERTTNNRMELMAIDKALDWLYEHAKNEDAIIYTDSAYVANCFLNSWYIKWQSNGWITAKKEPVKNKDLWEQIITKFQLLNQAANIQIKKIKGHAGHTFNVLADRYATLSIQYKQSYQRTLTGV